MTAHGESSFVFSHIGLCIYDLERSIRFYREVFGFIEAEVYDSGSEVDRLLGLRNVRERAQWMRHPNGLIIELQYYYSPTAVGSRNIRPQNQLGVTHLAFYVNDIDLFVARVSKCEGTVLDNRTTIGDVNIQSCADPDGVRISLMQVIR